MNDWPTTTSIDGQIDGLDFDWTFLDKYLPACYYPIGLGWMAGWLTKWDRVVAHTLQTTQHSSHSCINGSGEWREECRLLWLCAVMKPSDMTGSVYSGNCKRNKQTEIDSSPGGLSIPLATGRLILVGVWCRCTQRTSTTTGSSSYDWPPPSPSTSRKDK